MDIFCVSNLLLRFLLFGLLCFALGVGCFGALAYWSAPNQSERIVDQLQTRSDIIQNALDEMTEQHRQRKGQVVEELKRRRRMNHTDPERDKT
jgi:hypothetical protein